MAEKEIGLRIRLNGLNAVVKDITTFENEIRKAKEDLKQVEIGSTIFRELQQEIGLAESQLLDLIQSTKRLTKERQIEGIGKLGQGVASSFAAATAAVSLFGTKSEEVQKAATAAQNLLTLALSARGIAEVKLGAQLVARTIAEKAATAATAAQGTALEGLYVIMAANPYGVIIAAIGALVAAYALLGSAEEEEIKKTKTLNELRTESLTTADAEISKIKVLTEIIQDNTNSLDARQGAYRQLQKLIPDLANLTLEEAQSQDILNKAIDREIKLIQLRAEQKALENYLVQEAEKKIAKEQKARENYIKSLQTSINQERQRLFYAGLTYDEVEKSIEQFTRGHLATQEFKDVNQQLVDVTKQIVTLEAEQQKQIDNTKKSIDNAAKSKEKQKKQQEEYIKLLAEELKLRAQLIGQGVKIGEIDNGIIKTTEQKVESAKALASELNKLKTIQQLYDEANQSLSPSIDNVGEALKQAREELEFYYDTLKTGKVSEENRLKLTENLGIELQNIAKNLGLNAEQTQVLLDLKQNYEQLYLVINEYGNLKQIKPPFNATEFEKAIVDYNLSVGKIIEDPFGRTAEELEIAKGAAKNVLEELKNSFVKSFEIIQRAKDEAAKKPLLSPEQYREAGKAIFDNLVATGSQIAQIEGDVVITEQKVAELNAELAKLGPLARRGFILQNADEIVNQYGVLTRGIVKSKEELTTLQEKLRRKDFKEEEKYKEALIYLEENLKAQKIDIADLTYAEKLTLLEKYLKKEVDATEQAEEDKQKKIKKRNEDIQQSLDMFNDLIGETSSLLQQKIQMDMDALEKTFNESLNNIVGDTDEANQKRLELTKQYETQKAAIEKQALIKSLQAQKLQAVASAASAIISAQELLPPFNIIQTAIIAGVTAAQIALIQQQISEARSMAGGGMIFGPSHEKGGVFAGGGYNLEGGESVINKSSTVQYGNLLSSINQMGGGKAIINNQSGGMMEERLLQALAKTKSEPIRAYVLNSEITNGQAINKRLNQLATF